MNKRYFNLIVGLLVCAIVSIFGFGNISKAATDTPCFTFQVVASEPHGDPIVGATVKITKADDTSITFTAETVEGKGAVFKNIPSGMYNIEVSLDGNVIGTKSVEAPAGSSSMCTVLVQKPAPVQEHTVRVKVIDSFNNEPIADVKVRDYFRDTFKITDKNGIATFKVPTGDSTFSVNTAWYSPESIRVEVTSDADYELPLTREEITGNTYLKVIDRETNIAIPNIELYVKNRDTNEEVARAISDKEGKITVKGLWKGNYSLNFDGNEIYEKAYVQFISYSITDPGYVEASTSTKAKQINKTIKVKDTDGNPLQLVRVALEGKDYTGSVITGVDGAGITNDKLKCGTEFKLSVEGVKGYKNKELTVTMLDDGKDIEIVLEKDEVIVAPEPEEPTDSEEPVQPEEPSKDEEVEVKPEPEQPVVEDKVEDKVENVIDNKVQHNSNAPKTSAMVNNRTLVVGTVFGLLILLSGGGYVVYRFKSKK